VTRIVTRSDWRDEYEDLFRREGIRLWRVMYGVARGRRDIADEAVSEAFTRAMERSDSISDPLAWIYRTAFRFARGELKREGRLRKGDENLPDSGPVSEDAPSTVGELNSALASLSTQQRTAVILHYSEDLPAGEVARLMGISTATVRVHLHRGRKRLRQLLGTEEERND
jgi:RNA polymerase sigma-70 factor (ECF subfamily)